MFAGIKTFVKKKIPPNRVRLPVAGTVHGPLGRAFYDYTQALKDAKSSISKSDVLSACLAAFFTASEGRQKSLIELGQTWVPEGSAGNLAAADDTQTHARPRRKANEDRQR